MWLFDLSLRHKLPIWGGVLILATSMVLILSLGMQTNENLKQDMIDILTAQKRSLINSVSPFLLHDDRWNAYELINTPSQSIESNHLNFNAKTIIIMNKQKQVFVSNSPELYPIDLDLSLLDHPFGVMAKRITDATTEKAIEMDEGDPQLFMIGFPIISDRVVLGGIIMIVDKNLYWPRLLGIARQTTFIILLVLTVLLPINWYWGRRMAIPLVELAGQLKHIGEKIPSKIDVAVYDYADEVGELFQSFNMMISQLEEKAYLEKQMLQSERMAALGRLTASMAHEINNPLSGMLTAVDTLQRHETSLDRLTQKTISLLERGLQQIKETVGALLVEARFNTRTLGEHDVKDVITLVSPQIQQLHTQFECTVERPGESTLPANLVRQIMINLLLNAIKAAGENGRVSFSAINQDCSLVITVTNNGRQIREEEMTYLYEPFNPLSERGSGLGLWVTYQITQQMGGEIEAKSTAGLTTFTVHLPCQDYQT